LISELDIKTPRLDPLKCIVNVENKANLNERTKRHAIDVMNIVTQKAISTGKSPTGLAATVLYISSIKRRALFRRFNSTKKWLNSEFGYVI
jgi:transcription initiation factor TFIIIB Brf1 subunit/transcription initiation factor TFIIB